MTTVLPTALFAALLATVLPVLPATTLPLVLIVSWLPTVRSATMETIAPMLVNSVCMTVSPASIMQPAHPVMQSMIIVS